MSTIEIVLTNDYEIFGDGRSDIRFCLIEPTDRLLEIAGKYNIPITIMAEVCEYWAFKNEELKETLPRGYRPASWIEEQLINCVQNKHDVQLHIHPQWINYSFDLNTYNWKVGSNYCKVSSLSYEEIYELLRRGKQELEDLLKPNREGYECFVFRAGAWSIQPEEQVLKALINVGFRIDTSVASGCCFKSRLINYDFKETPHKLYWFIKESIKEETTAGILELPIYSRKYFIHDKIYYKFLRRKKRVPKDYKDVINFNARELFFKRLLPKYVMFDFCAMSAVEIIDILKYAERKFRNQDFIPVIAIGHSKTFNNARDFDSFIKKALNRGYNFTTFRDLLNKINDGSTV